MRLKADRMVSGSASLAPNLVQQNGLAYPTQARQHKTLLEGDLADTALLERIFGETPVAAVMHFAALSQVGESIREVWLITNTLAKARHGFPILLAGIKPTPGMLNKSRPDHVDLGLYRK